MSLLPTNRSAEADRSSLENDRAPIYTSNVTTVPAHTLTGRDSVRPDESPTNTLIVADLNYSKRPSGKSKFSPILIGVNFVSILSDLY